MRLAYRNVIRLIISLICILFPGSSVTYWTGGSPGIQMVPKADQATTLRVTTRLVTISVVARDKKGNPVTDLTRDDFVLLEESKPQKIESFALESRRAQAQINAVLPPNIYVNRTPQQGFPSAVVSLILLDGINTRIENQNYARERIIIFLGQIEPEDRVAIYAMDQDGVFAIHDFSSDSKSLLAALSGYRARYPFGLDPINPGESPSSVGGDEGATALAGRLDRFLSQAQRAWTDFQDTQRVLKTTAVLRGIASRLARFPGRKNLIWISSGFPLATGAEARVPLMGDTDGRSFYREAERAGKELSSASVVVYPVDARGLIGGMPAPAEDKRSGRLPRGRPLVYQDTVSGVNTMRLLAEETGGRAFYNRNELDGAIRNAIEDARVSYTLGYYPLHGKWDGRFVKIKVKVKRSDVNIQARTGYYAAARTQLSEKDLLALLEDAARSPLDATAIGVAVRTAPTEETTPKTLKFVIDIDPRDISLLFEGGRWTGGIDLMLVQQRVDGNAVSKIAQTFDLRLSPEEYAKMGQNGLVINHAVEVQENASRLRVVVRDSCSGAVGTVAVPLSKTP